MVWLAEMAQSLRDAAKVIDEIIEVKMEINVTGKTTKKGERRLQELMNKYGRILNQVKE